MSEGVKAALVAGEEDWPALLALAALGFSPEEMRVALERARARGMRPEAWIRQAVKTCVWHDWDETAEEWEGKYQAWLARVGGKGELPPL